MLHGSLRGPPALAPVGPLSLPLGQQSPYLPASMNSRQFVIIGGGPAGLTAGLELVRHGLRPLVLEQAQQVGGLARTESYRGFRFDMGGHRFFTKVPEVFELWRELLGSDFLKRPRMSRIYYRRRFLLYPLQAFDTVKHLGPVEACLILASYFWAQVRPHRPETTFEQWVTNRFGRRLFRTFFKSYTEKVWGVSCSELRAEWAAQRIKDLSVRTLLRQTLTGGGRKVTSLLEEFHYPRLGPGMMWERAAEHITRGGDPSFRRAGHGRAGQRSGGCPPGTGNGLHCVNADLRIGGSARAARIATTIRITRC